MEHFFPEAKYLAELGLVLTGHIQLFFFSLVQELECALPGLSEWQGKAGCSANNYAQNVALKCQEAVVRFQPR